MSAPTCGRAWQAEAREDGRLAPADAASFERHADTCDACRRELHVLQRLRELGSRLPDGARAPLAQRRLRYRLMQRANALMVHETGARAVSGRNVVTLAFGLSAIAAAAYVAVSVFAPFEARVPAAGRPSESTASTAAPTFRVVAEASARWRTLERGSTLRVAVRRGRVELDVDPLRPGQRFLVELPDGELEVRGTRFVVLADDVHTRRVYVREGRVVLRLRGQPKRALNAGDAWSGSPQVADRASAAPSRLEPPRAQRSDAPPTEETKPGAAAHSRHTRRAPTRDPIHAPAAEMPTKSDSTFARAVAAFSAGDYGSSDRLLTAFIHEHPSDARVEDALFLRAVGLARRGHRKQASAVAREYLRRFPNGLRRTEAAHLADAASD